MKKWISILLVTIMAFNVCVGDFHLKANAKEEIHTPILDNYSVSKEYIQKGDSVDITFNLADENIKSATKLKNAYVKMADDSAFAYTGSGFTTDTIQYDKDKCGGQITFDLKNAVYQGEGHKLAMIYGFNLNGEKYENLIAFSIEETMRRVPKAEAPIKGFDLIAEDKQRGTTPKEPIKQDGEEEQKEKIDGIDERVRDAQRWLNQRYGGKPGYTNIPEDGVPGTRVASAFVTGLQIDLGIPQPTGIFGDATKAAFNAQIGSLNLGSQDSADKPYVTMLQHAMFCKGYSPGSVNGIFGPNTSSGILKMKSDAGFIGASDSSVDSMWFKAVLSSDAYVVVNNGDPKIRNAQQYLNRNYYNYFGIEPCDGHYSRDTNKAVIYALQAEEGLDTDTANGRFGPTTKARCPNLPNDARYSAETLKNFIMILQFELYFNQAELYSQIDFNGFYSDTIRKSVSAFQKFMCLPNTSGFADVGTIMSLMVSTGDPERSARGCDCSVKLDAAKVLTLYSAGYRYVGRYLTNVPGGIDKRMDVNEFHTISQGGLRVFPIFQQGNEFKDHFSEAQGKIDASLAVEAMRKLYKGNNATIYFAVDYDFMDYEVTQQVIPYFTGVNEVMHNTYKDEYKVGIYGSRNICTRVSSAGLATTSFVSDLSTGYSGNYGYAMPKNWAFDQYSTYKFSGFDLDKDAVSGRDNGISLNTKYNYNRNAARNYMDIWNNSYNPQYYHYGADCANYVSQCLAAGGIPMTDFWYSYKTDDIDNNNEILNAEDASFNVGEQWRLAKKQYEYFKDYDYGYINGEVIRINRTDDIKSIIKQCNDQGKPIHVGDLMYFADDNKGGVHHATIISKLDEQMIYYSAHTGNCLDKSLSAGFDDNPNDGYVYIIRLKNCN